MKRLFSRVRFFGLLGIFLMLLPTLAFASGEGSVVDGTKLAWYWALPFVGMLLSIAICPMAIPNFWGKHFGKGSLFWSLAFLVPYGIFYSFTDSFVALSHTMVLEYIPFMILLFSLFTISGGIRLTGSLAGTPMVNTIMILIGTALASVMGTTGAAMLLIRPVLRANGHRKHKVHTIVFFIFLVANIGGSLTPLGDPPLFLGFLKGVDFFWTLKNIHHETMTLVAILLPLYFIVDSIFYAKEGRPTLPEAKERLGIEGGVNFILLAGVVLSVLVSGTWKPDTKLPLFGETLGLPHLVRDITMLLLTGISIAITRKSIREANNFNWEPILEVAKVFFGIFVSMIPAIAILKAGPNGALHDLVALVTRPDGTPVNAAYFWLSGGLSSFLDNAPTYLVFFNMAGGNAHTLMGEVSTLAAISCGSVFMGANTYIGNAPNFMVKSMATAAGVKMPTFFGYMFLSIIILIPCFLLLTYLFF